MGKYQAYPEYEDTKVQWLPDMPHHWGIERIKRMLRLKRTLVGKKSSEYQLLSLTLKGIITRDISTGEGKIPESFDTYQEVEKNDLVFCLFDMDETPRTVGLSALDGMITGAYNVYGCLDKCYPAYASYYFLHIDKFKGLRPFYTGLRKVVRSETFDNIEIPCPPYEEQAQIANFLDHETAKIDTLIEKQQQLIKLLKEKRQAVISHAVTKGLNPQAPMKDSGVEWLGEVPEDWVVSRLGFHTLKIGSGKTPKGGAEIYQKEGVLFLRSQNVYDDGLRISESESVYISESIHDEMRTTKVFGGDILLNITGGSIGRTCLVPLEFIEANVNQHVCIIRLPNCLREFISMVLKSTPIKEQIGAIQTGGNREGLNFEQISKFSFALPPESERGEIVQSVKISLAKLDALEEQSNRAIKLMQERRTALISAAVTGKIDVRNWQAPTCEYQATEQTA
ncbi:restriction endonuclease subunit S [Vibrio fluvialis]|uniref:restriction endonuclease subunit S n=1 Tax=Vibrio fluvialis TaxID=676 RepID=UPI001EEC0735|nr:restriction endonuclease subunit S [Vibrio fluvialis]MCG6405475.1 restriction endonuclease subunit S [Vibrio fluvialis]